MAPTITAVINTLNEESNIAIALRSIRSWVDEIVVVDMHSDDSTVDIAHEFGAKVFLHDRMGFADPARAYALEQATGDWVLILDADECIPFALSRELTAIAARDAADVVAIPRLNYLLGMPLMHTQWGPEQDTHFRFFKRGHLNATSAVHDYLHPLVSSRVLKLRYQPELAIVHFNYRNSEQFLERLNRYTNIEAQQAFARGDQMTPAVGVVKAAGEFVNRYVVGSGWRDGWRGFYLSLFMAFYRLVKAAKLRELAEFGDGEMVRARYLEQAERIVQEYGAALRAPVGRSSGCEPRNASTGSYDFTSSLRK